MIYLVKENFFCDKDNNIATQIDIFSHRKELLVKGSLLSLDESFCHRMKFLVTQRNILPLDEFLSD